MTWMTWNGVNVTLAEINKIYGAQRKKLNEDTCRSILLAAKCRPMILVSRNIKYMRIFAGVTSGRGAKYNECKRLADVERGVFILDTCRCVLLASHTIIG